MTLSNAEDHECSLKCLAHKLVLNITQVAADTQRAVQREYLIKMEIRYKVFVLLVKENVIHDSAFAPVLYFSESQLSFVNRCCLRTITVTPDCLKNEISCCISYPSVLIVSCPVGMGER